MRLVMSLLAVFLLLTGCAAGPEVSPEEQVPEAERTTEAAIDGGEQQALIFVAGDIFYDHPPTTAPAGTLSVVIENVGNLEHNVVFEGLNNEQPVVAAAGGETEQGSITLQPGTYTFYCSIPGHREAGMEGTLEVTE